MVDFLRLSLEYLCQISHLAINTKMKTIIIITSLIISQAVFAQPNVKLYGYSQEITPGMVPQRGIPDESNGGRVIKTPAVTTYYYVYTRASVFIQPDEIWIGGKWHIATSKLIKEMPVVTESPVKKTLVPFTKLKVLQVEQGDTLTSIPFITPVLKKMMTTNELIVSYTWKGKKNYAALKKLSVLETIHGQ